jgi:hypothetical protein
LDGLFVVGIGWARVEKVSDLLLLGWALCLLEKTDIVILVLG